MDSFGSGQGPVRGPYEHGNESSVSKEEGNFLNRRVTISFSIRTLLYGSQLVS